MEETVTPKHAHRMRQWFIRILVVVVTLLLGGFFWWFFAIRDSGPIPRTYTKGLDFSLYYPTRLPTGYTVDHQSFEVRDKSILVFSINAPNGRNIAVTEQLKPADAPVHSKNNVPIKTPGERAFNTGIGDAYISLWGDKYVADISTPTGTWIILNVTRFTVDEAMTIANSFTEIH